MKHRFKKINILITCIIFTLIFCTGCADSNDSSIVILHTNDTHCDIDSNLGFDGVAAYKDEMESEYDNVTLVDAGDFIQGGPVGSLSDGEYIIEIMNEMEYDVVTLGNHEFDYKVEKTIELMEELTAEKTSSNFIDLETGESVYDSYVIEDYGVAKVAFVGVTTPESLTASYFQDENGEYIYGFCQGNNGEDLYANVQESVDGAISEGADYVIALTHLGVEEKSEPWRSTDLIENTTGIDVVIDGHSHTTIDGEIYENLEGEDVILTQTGSKFENLGEIIIDTENDSITTSLVSSDDYTEKDADIEAFIDDINSDLDVVLDEVIGYSEVDLIANNNDLEEETSRKAETNLGDLVTDAYREILDTDIAIINGAGIRENINMGDITYEDIINVQPFNNQATSVSVSGQTILDALEMGAKDSPNISNGFLQVSGMTYTIDTSIPSSVVTNDEGGFVEVDGEYRVKDVMIDDEPISLDKMYTVASYDYLLLYQGDGMTMFEGAEVVQDRVMVDNELLITYIVDNLGGKIGNEYSDITGQGRITIY